MHEWWRRIKVWPRVETCNGSVRGFVKWEGLKKMVEELMEGEMGKEVRKNVEDYGELARKAMEVGGGSSWCNLDALVNDLITGAPKEHVKELQCNQLIAFMKH
ncbi:GLYCOSYLTRANSFERASE [Salix purpurea]|uniref:GLYCOSYLTRANSFERASE n=1 Tax=Salix purpurea TaxID=77065 RepID=A0A9Q0WH85_SALPP|nr:GLYCOSYLTRANSFERASE [Salix purpurea]